MSKHFSFSLIGVVLLVFAIYILIAGTPLSRINRTCAPIGWAGKAVSAVGGIFSDKIADTLKEGADSTSQGCRYVVFKTFYSAEFKKAQAAAEAAKRAAAAKAKKSAAKKVGKVTRTGTPS